MRNLLIGLAGAAVALATTVPATAHPYRRIDRDRDGRIERWEVRRYNRQNNRWNNNRWNNGWNNNRYNQWNNWDRRDNGYYYRNNGNYNVQYPFYNHNSRNWRGQSGWY